MWGAEDSFEELSPVITWGLDASAFRAISPVVIQIFNHTIHRSLHILCFYTKNVNIKLYLIESPPPSQQFSLF